MIRLILRTVAFKGNKMIKNNLIFKSETKCETSRVKKDGLKTTSNPPRTLSTRTDNKHFTTDMLLRIINKLKTFFTKQTQPKGLYQIQPKGLYQIQLKELYLVYKL